ncbi:SCA7, zinc-binding domain-containing protein [Mucor mucedo]|uniref:SCA7, zinc-binding domain-containing protein n=1 Tax=Mucor mucedo TaxID=29922 RepID=UPI0022205B04|nr:SCA7, zinc-binding domain-containing protein [Mucor mucedo]KAI7872617.1 SCA7, zinc-binding domain-containing protein [Mucor mucedo]
MAGFGKKAMSGDEDSDDMGSTRANKKTTLKKRKRYSTKEEETDSVSVVVPNHHHQQDAEKKKLKKEKKPKQKATPKKKAPLDLDRQCGVIITPSNHPCTRSLTCKIHAMGAKRSVEGRTQPFNDLLAAYQKKVPGTMNDKDKLDGTKKTWMNTGSSHKENAKTEEEEEGEDERDNNEGQEIDSDEETESVRIAIEQTKPIPLGKRQLFYVCRKRKYYKLRDILLDAITPKDSTSSSSVSATPVTAASEVYSQRI